MASKVKRDVFRMGKRVNDTIKTSVAYATSYEWIDMCFWSSNGLWMALFVLAIIDFHQFASGTISYVKWGIISSVLTGWSIVTILLCVVHQSQKTNAADVRSTHLMRSFYGTILSAVATMLIWSFYSMYSTSDLDLFDKRYNQPLPPLIKPSMFSHWTGLMIYMIVSFLVYVGFLLGECSRTPDEHQSRV